MARTAESAGSFGHGARKRVHVDKAGISMLVIEFKWVPDVADSLHVDSALLVVASVASDHWIKSALLFRKRKVQSITMESALTLGSENQDFRIINKVKIRGLATCAVLNTRWIFSTLIRSMIRTEIG